MFCPSCGKEIPDHSSFCLVCGKSIQTGTAPGYSVPVYAAPPPEESGVRRYAVVLFALVAAGFIIWLVSNSGSDASPRGSSSSVLRPFNKPLLSGSVAVAPLRVQYWKFDVSATMTNAHVTGSFHTVGGFGNDIEAIVAEWGECENWINGHHGEALYASGKVTNGAIDVPIPQAGTYCLAFSNKMALLSSKTVSGEIALQYLLP